MITADQLHRSYSIGKKQVEVLHGLSVHIARGERVFLCGPSGADDVFCFGHARLRPGVPVTERT